MVIELSQIFTHSPCNADDKKYSNAEVQDVILNLMKDNGIDTNGAQLGEDGVLKINDTPNLKLHSLMLRAEELGLEMKYTKKTLIEFC